jgi:hypothetical protein
MHSIALSANSHSLDKKAEPDDSLAGLEEPLTILLGLG